MTVGILLIAHTYGCRYDAADNCRKIYNKATSVFQVPPNKRPKHQNELFSMNWKLDLNWKKEPNYDRVRLTSSVTMMPPLDMREKLGDVWIIPGKVTLCVDDSSRLIKLSSDTPVVLKKENSYTYDLIPDRSAITVEFESKIKVTAEIIMMQYSLNIIEPVDMPPCTVLQNLATLMVHSEEESKQKFCDLKITATQSTEDNSKAVDFYTHKAILASRSTVFAKMFSSEMKESATLNTLSLPDIEADVLKELLTYIYTGECPNIKAHAPSLLCAAEKYDLSRLKALCEERLSYNLKIDNAASMLMLADTYKAKQLKRNALLFIHEHGKAVKRTKEWEDVKESAELLHDLITTIYDEPATERIKLD